jgi:hypothetical protein
MTRHFINTAGLFLGNWDDPADAPAGAVEISSAPTISTQVWDGAAWIAGPPPPPPQPSPREWLERLSATKQAAIAAGGIANAQILLWLLKASGSSSIDVTLQETQQGVAALVSAGILSADDQAVLLAP